MLLILVGSLASAQTPAEDYARGLRLFQQERYVEALPYFEQAREDAARHYGERSAEHAIELNNLAELYRRLDRYDEAEPLFLQALAIDEARVGADDPGLATTMNNLGLLYRAQGRFDEAERHLARSLALLEASLGHRHPDIARSLNNLAMLYQATGRPANALPLLERAVSISRDLLGEAHPTTLRLAQNRQEVTESLSEQQKAEAPERETAGDMARGPAPPPPSLPSPVSSATPVREPLVLPEAKGGTPLPLPDPGNWLPADTADAAATIPAAPLAAPEIAAVAPRPAPAQGEATPLDSAPKVSPIAKQWATLAPGSYAMHLASVRSPASAVAEWARLAERLELPATIRQIEPQRIEIPVQGVFYRVMGGPFASPEAVEAACVTARATGQYCAVIAQGG